MMGRWRSWSWRGEWRDRGEGCEGGRDLDELVHMLDEKGRNAYVREGSVLCLKMSSEKVASWGQMDWGLGILVFYHPMCFDNLYYDTQT
jgi:hypothetical protein